MNQLQDQQDWQQAWETYQACGHSEHTMVAVLATLIGKVRELEEERGNK